MDGPIRQLHQSPSDSIYYRHAISVAIRKYLVFHGILSLGAFIKISSIVHINIVHIDIVHVEALDK